MVPSRGSEYQFQETKLGGGGWGGLELAEDQRYVCK